MRLEEYLDKNNNQGRLAGGEIWKHLGSQEASRTVTHLSISGPENSLSFSLDALSVLELFLPLPVSQTPLWRPQGPLPQHFLQGTGMTRSLLCPAGLW